MQRHMTKDLYKSLSGAVRHLLREQEFTGRGSERSQKRLCLVEITAEAKDMTMEEIYQTERLIQDNFLNGWDDALYRRCPPGGLNGMF